MTRPFALYLTGLVGAALVALLATSFLIPVDGAIGIEVDGAEGVGPADILAGILFWTAITFVASAAAVRVSDGHERGSGNGHLNAV